MHMFIMIDIGAALLLFGLVPLAHWVLHADARHLRKSAVRAERREVRLEEERLQVEVERAAEEAELRRQFEEAQQAAIWAKHRPIKDADGARWGRTLSAPPPWKQT